ncbi:Glycoside hydrolase family 79 [Lasiodiplodia theobromae]|uniref:Glycoside hydrolase family 79 n=1 Tax=Lasiodiplodia theobromae TaxID=45133 RepID=UPI0015C37C3F|nr:Glycoside hydrolase family 79 [Lasiodiplodia theobromae]KAF4534706.1 Glycoside hydrolase family 79 [Lasiodiplodia theobromae]
MPSSAAFFSLVLSVSAAVLPRQTEDEVIVLEAPSAPPDDHNVVDASFQSYSIEFNYMLDYAGNNSHPNEYSIQMLENLGTLAGAYPYIRVGGTTQNRNVYYSNQTVALNQTFTNPWDDQPSRLSTGPDWFESFQQFPKGTKYIYGLNFYEGEWGLNNTVEQAIPAWLAMGDSLYAYEIGNEVNGWASSSRRPDNWTIYDYISEWITYSEAVRDGIRAQPGHSSDTPYFQGCAYVAPRAQHLANSTTWNVANTIRLGMGDSPMLRSVADHDYMGANCAGAPVPTLRDNLLDHHHMTSLAYWHEALGAQTSELGVPYALGETNSISCQGTAGVSDVFGAALWAVDYVLYIAGLKGLGRLYFHSGSVYRYAPWQPTTINGTAPYAKPLYYGNLFAAQALGGSGGGSGGGGGVDLQVVSILNETRQTAYGVYEGAELRSVAVVNLEMFNSTQEEEERVYTVFKLPEDVDWDGAEVRRLTAPGVEVKTGVTYAGRSVDDDGKLAGEEEVEAVKDGEVRVGAGEAVLVTL